MMELEEKFENGPRKMMEGTVFCVVCKKNVIISKRFQALTQCTDSGKHRQQMRNKAMT